MDARNIHDSEQLRLRCLDEDLSGLEYLVVLYR
jgi:hypothetical protein